MVTCPRCIEKETGLPHPAHVGRCGLPTGHLGVVSCYCTVTTERRLEFLILTMPDREIVSLSLREGIDFIDEDWPEFGAFYILETA